MSTKNVKPYKERTNSKKDQVRQMFNKVAPTYDLLNRILSMGIDQQWRKKMVEILDKSQPKIVLDVATGTADVAIAIANKLPNTSVVGIDLSPQMLEYGHQKIQKRNLQNQVKLEVGDSEKITYPDSTFDAATVAFGVRNFENLKVGLQEMARVIKPKGQVLILEFSKPRIFPFKQIYDSYFRYILPTIGKITSKDQSAYQYLYESVQAFPDGDDFVSVLESVGLQHLHTYRLTLGICTIYHAIKSS